MSKTASMLSERGIPTDVMCLADYDFIDNTHCNSNWFFIFNGFVNKIHIPVIDKLAGRITRFLFARFFISNYSKIDFHSYTRDYNWLMRECVERDVAFDITLWGSDVMRSTEENFAVIRYGFEHCHSIRGIPLLLNKLSDVYGDVFEHKYVCTFFGNSNLEVLDKLDESKVFETGESLFGKEYHNKIIITCGYNAAKEQQHEMIIESLQHLPNDIKEKIHAVFPLTYGLTDEYESFIRAGLDKSGVSYKLLNNFLTVDELMVLRKESDITINTQTTDAFCSAIQEHLYCENILLIGEWLKYPMYDENNVWYIKINKDNLTSSLTDVIEHFSTYKSNTVNNQKLVRQIVSWDCVIDDWVKAVKM